VKLGIGIEGPEAPAREFAGARVPHDLRLLFPLANILGESHAAHERHRCKRHQHRTNPEAVHHVACLFHQFVSTMRGMK
jgi:hypothetical protein